MRTIIEEKNIYKFDELSSQAKQKAVYHFACSMDYSFNEDNRQSVELFLASIGYNLVNYCISDCEPSWIRISSRDSDQESLTGTRLYGFIYKWYAANFLTRKRYSKGNIYSKESKIRLSRINRVEEGCPFTGYYMDDAATAYIKATLFEGKFDPTMTLDEFVHNCIDLFVKDWQADYEYYYSEENVEELSEANEWEYLEDGSFYAA